MEGENKVLKTVVRNGVAFDNFPVYVSESYGDSYLMRDEELAAQLAAAIPAEYRTAVRIDCNQINEFQEPLPDYPVTEKEMTVIRALEGTKRN